MNIMDNKTRRAYRVDEIAELLGISRSGAYKLVNGGYIRCIRVGKLILIPVDAFEEFMNNANAVLN